MTSANLKDESGISTSDLELPLPRFMAGRPFGNDTNGRTISDVRGETMRRLVAYLEHRVEMATRDRYGSASGAPDALVAIEQAGSRATNDLVRQLNAAISDPTYHVTADSLAQSGSAYSFEFFTYAVTCCTEITRDAGFAYRWVSHMGLPPGWLILSGLPLSSVYASLPTLVRFLSYARLDCEKIAENQVLIRLTGEVPLSDLPGPVRARLFKFTRDILAGLLVELPRLHANLPVAEIVARMDLLNGDPYTEWLVTWKSTDPGPLPAIANVVAGFDRHGGRCRDDRQPGPDLGIGVRQPGRRLAGHYALAI